LAEREKSGFVCDVKNSFMFGAFWSFAVKGGRFQFDSIVETTEKWLYAVDEVYAVFTTGPAHTV